MTLPDDLHSLAAWAEFVGKIPPGDVPAAWYLSTHPEVIKGYEKWRRDYKAWKDRLTELLQLSGLPTTEKVRYGGWHGQCLVGIYADLDPNLEPPMWWRRTKEGYLVPRRRTKAEKDSEVSQRFAKVQNIPSCAEYLPGMPSCLYMPGKDMSTHIYWPGIRINLGKAVLVFWGADPDQAEEPFEPDERWQRMKLSTYHLLRERQLADAGTPR